MADNVTTPYESAKRLINASGIPSWINSYDALRYASYDLYEDMYWTEPGTFKLQQRGTDENPIYIPSGRIIVNTMDRYTGRDWTPVMDDAYGTPVEQAAGLMAMTDLIRRERLQSMFETGKLWGLMRGDWYVYITGSTLKPEGSRISVRNLDPREVFPITAPRDAETIWGYDIVEQILNGEDMIIKRIRYLKSAHPDHPATGNPAAPISYQMDYLEVENWEDPEEQKTTAGLGDAVAPVLMPGIFNLPVYHVPNLPQPGNPFGSSEMRGLERIFAAVNQSISDEELTLSLQGLGMYKSEKGQPRDANGNPTTWQLGPGKVIHDDTFDRVTGVTTVTPFLDHLKYLEDRMHETTGSSDVARGKVDVTVAESGIALSIRLGPIIDASAKKDTIIREVWDNIMYDLRDWFKAYEKIDLTNVRFNSTFGQKIPTDVSAEFDRLLKMVQADPPLITMGYFREACRELGMRIPATETGATIAAEMAAMQELTDPYAGRMAEESEDTGGEEDPAADGVEV